MTRKSKADWFWACAQLISEQGAKKLTINALCKKVEVTKGSFYHHFSGIDDFIDGYLIFFEQEGTLQIIETVEQENDPKAKLRKLIELSTQHPPHLERGTRAWAQQDQRVREVFERVDQQRIAYLIRLWRPLVGDEPAARVQAQTMYSILIGGEHLIPPLSREQHREVFDRYLEAVGL